MKYRLLWVFLPFILVWNCGDFSKTVPKVSEYSRIWRCDVDTLPIFGRLKLLSDSNQLSELIRVKDSLPVNSIAHAFANYRLGILYRGRGNSDSTDYYQFLALQQFTEGDTVVVERAARICNSIAYDSKFFSDKRKFAEKGIDILQAYKPYCSYDQDLLPELYSFAADASLDQDDVVSGSRFAHGGLDEREEGTAEYIIANLYRHLGSSYLEATNYSEAKSALDSAEAQLGFPDSLDSLDALDLMYVYDVRQQFARDTGNEVAALHYARTALRIRQQYDSGSIKEAHSLNNYGRILFREGDFRAGEKHINEALNLYTALNTQSGRGTAFESLALSAELQHDLPRALRLLDSAIVAYHGNPARPGLVHALDKSELRDPLFTKAQLLARDHAADPNRTPLTEVQAAVAQVDSINLLLRHNVRTERSKRYIIRQNRELSEKLITFFLNQFDRTGAPQYQQLALFSLESAKARILSERRTRLREQPSGAADASSETELTNRIAELRLAIGEAEQKDRKEALMVERQQAEHQLWQLRDERYARTSYLPEEKFTEAVLPALSKSVGQETAILNYFIGQQAVFVAVARAGEVAVRKLEIASGELLDRIGRFRTAVEAPGRVNKWKNDSVFRSEQLKVLAREGNSLYGTLIKAAFPGEKVPEDLIVIPDGTLHTLPFAALLTEPGPLGGDCVNWPFLLREHTLNHRFSARLWHQQRRAPMVAGTKALIVAPEQDTIRTVPGPLGEAHRLRALTFVDEEVEVFSDAFYRNLFSRPDVWRGPAAARFARPSELEDYGLIHFAGHGLAYPVAEEASFLALDLDSRPQKKLTVEAMASAPRPLELLVLSACETHAGKVDQSEGVISLARAASLAGAHSVVSTLWQVPQKDKPDFFADYYRFLKTGEYRSAALRRAQIRLLLEEDHPYFWAAYINLGAGNPLPEQLLP